MIETYRTSRSAELRTLQQREHPESRISPNDNVVFQYLVDESSKARVSRDWAIFNTAVIETRQTKLIISRAIHIPQLEPSVPDKNVLVVGKIEKTGQTYRLPDLNLETGEEEGEIFNWEDPRAEMLDETKVRIGLTAVRRENGTFAPHPATVDIAIENDCLNIESVNVFEEVGKNTVPLNGTFIYRPEDQTHVLHLVKPKGKNLEVINTIDFTRFSHIPWLRTKVGTVTRPIPKADGTLLLPIHGVNTQPSPEFHHYAVGLAQVTPDWEVLAVGSTPLLERKDFNDVLHPQEDLNWRQKSVVYTCSMSQAAELVKFYVNVGDRITVEKTFTREQLENYPMSQAR